MKAKPQLMWAVVDSQSRILTVLPTRAEARSDQMHFEGDMFPERISVVRVSVQIIKGK